MTQAHVICLNDSVEHVVIGTENQAMKLLVQLKIAYWKRNRWIFNNNQSDYNLRCYWHIHTVPAEIHS